METTKTTSASRVKPGKRAPASSDARTNRDWVMIALGIFLIVFFIAAGYVSIIKTEKNSPLRKRGPVKHPKKLGSVAPNNEFYKTGKALEISRRLGDNGTAEDRIGEIG